MKHIFLIGTLFIFNLSSFSQIMRDKEIDESKVSQWTTSNLNDYEGIYFFGISEAESEVVVSINGNLISVQVQDYNYEKLKNGQSDWRPNYTNYKNCRIVENKFYSDQTNGEFVTYQIGNKITKGLKLENPPNGSNNEYEIGKFNDENKFEYINGKYKQTKFDVLTISQIEKYNLNELKIMRNEIFARYGYIFTRDNEMARYFGEQKWYLGIYNNVSNWLTDIEKQNIINIKLIEGKNKK